MKISLSKRIERTPTSSINVKKLALAERKSVPQKKFTVLSQNGTAQKVNLAKKRNVVAERKEQFVPRKLNLAVNPKNKYSYKLGKGITSVAKKPFEAAKGRVLHEDKDQNTGVEGAKMGLRAVDKAASNARHIKNAVKRTREIHSRVKRTSKATNRSLKTAKRTSSTTMRSLKTTAKATARTAKATAKASANAAKAGAKAAKIAIKATVQAAKAVASAVKQLVSLIAETAPYSLIVIAAIVVVLIIAIIVSMVSGQMAQQVEGAGGWAITDSANTPEKIYKEIDKHIKDGAKIMDNKVQKPLKSKVDKFCENDSTKPHKIIEYKSHDHQVTYFPANGNNSIVNQYIDKFDDNFDTEFYSNLLTILFVLMTREKQNADGMPDSTIYDLDMKKSDIEQLIGEVDQNSCKYGETYVYKSTTEVHGCTCPGANCERKTISGCRCCSRVITREDGTSYTSYYCGGHPYCPGNHTKLIITQYTIEQYRKSTIKEIYKLTENENTRFEATKTFIQGMIDSYGGG